MSRKKSEEVRSSRVATAPSTAYVAFVAMFYMGMSVFLVVLNKWVLALGSFSFPLFTTWFQCVITSLCAVVATQLFGRKGAFIRPLDINLAVLGSVSKLTVVFVIMLCTNNLSLRLVDVSFYPVARSLSILFTLFIDYYFGKPSSYPIITSCVVVMTGFFVGAEGQINLSVEGTVWGLLSSLFVSFYGVMTKSTLLAVDDSACSLDLSEYLLLQLKFLWIRRLMAFNNIIASVLLLPVVAMSGELDGALGYSLVDNVPIWSSLTLSGIAGFVLSLATFMLIKTTTPLTHLISGTFKNAILEIVSLVVLKEPVTSKGMVGIVLNMGGSAAYTVLKHREGQQAKKDKT